jgi:hypothetical protein
MKWVVKILFFTAVLVVAALASVIGTAFIAEYFPNPTPDPNVEIISSTGFRKAHEINYVYGCIKAGSSEQYCQCSFDNFKELYKPEELAELQDNFRKTGKLDDRMDQVRKACSHLK